MTAPALHDCSETLRPWLHSQELRRARARGTWVLLESAAAADPLLDDLSVRQIVTAVNKGRVLGSQTLHLRHGTGSRLDADPLGSFLDAAAFERAYAEGRGMLRIISAHQSFPSLDQCRRAAQAALGSSESGATLYVAPAGVHGSTPHTDPHDVLVVHIRGEKFWQVWDDDVPTTVRARAGDVLFVPRAARHVAWTETQSAIHATIGLL